MSAVTAFTVPLEEIHLEENVLARIPEQRALGKYTSLVSLREKAGYGYTSQQSMHTKF